MPFKDSLWDDSEPEYAPCSKFIHGAWRWIPPKRYIEQGYLTKHIKLDGPHVKSGPSFAQAKHCRELTKELVLWFEEQEQKLEPNTWGWLIAHYMSDPLSDYHTVDPSTREVYGRWMRRLKEIIGNVLIAETDYPRMAGWRAAMEKKGRSRDWIKKFFTHFGLVISHGVKYQVDGCYKVKIIRAEMRIPNPPSRSDYFEREQIEALVAECDARSTTAAPLVALAVLMRFEFMLRGVDIYGEWVKDPDAKGGIEKNGRQWVKGITWEMIDPDVTRITKLISKTKSSIPEPYTFELTHLPEIRRRLLAIPKAERVGPLFKMPSGTPPGNGYISRFFKKVLRSMIEDEKYSDLGLYDGLQLRDSRAGGITEAKDMVEPMELRDAAQHRQITTTDRYVRGRSESANKVIAIRAKNK